MLKYSLEIFLIFGLCLSGFREAEAFGEDLPLNGSSILSMLERKPKLNIVSFEPVGENIALGLDFLLPFINVPISQEVDVYGNEPALINVNTAALVSTGILAASSAFVSYLFRNYVLYDVMGKSEKTRRSDNNYDSEVWSLFHHVKVIYKNSTGEKADTSLTELLTTIDETFHQRGIDLSSCMQKALCQRLLQPEEYQPNNENGRKSSALDQIVDGLVGLKWVRQNILRFSSLNDIVADGDDDEMLTMKHQRNRLSCEARYPKCRWSIPKSQNVDSLFGTYLKFI